MKKLLTIGLTLIYLAGLPACVSPSNDGGKTAEPPATGAAESTATLGDTLVDRYFRDVARELILRRDSAMRTLIELDQAESDRFWSIKAEYDNKVREVFDAELELIARYSEANEELSRKVAADIAKRALELDRRRVDLHEEYFVRMKDEFSPIVAVQWLQLQTYFEHRAQVRFAEGTALAMP